MVMSRHHSYGTLQIQSITTVMMVPKDISHSPNSISRMLWNWSVNLCIGLSHLQVVKSILYYIQGTLKNGTGSFWSEVDLIIKRRMRPKIRIHYGKNELALNLNWGSVANWDTCPHTLPSTTNYIFVGVSNFERNNLLCLDNSMLKLNIKLWPLQL